MRHLLIACSSLALATFAVTGQSSNPQSSAKAAQKPASQSRGTELTAVRAAADHVHRALRADGSGLTIVRPYHELHRSLHGSFSGEQVVPIASASKWLAVATIMSLVDEGKLDLDLPVSRYVEEFDGDDKRRITLRQCLSHVSALPAQMNQRMKGWNMARFAEEAADKAMRTNPGTGFAYGGVGFQMVAIAAERVSGMTWHDLFSHRIAEPLGMRDTKFGTLQPIAADPGTTALPWVAGGAVSTLNDYTRFVRMLLAKGEWHGRTILSNESVDQMFRDQVPRRVNIKNNPLSVSDARYGLGTWIEERKGVLRLTCPGAFGFTPWIDPDLEIGGVFAVESQWKRVQRQMPRIYGAAREAVQAPEVAGTSETVAMRHGGRDRRYHLHVPPYDQSNPGMPVILVLHGGGGSGQNVRATTGFDKLGVQAGFVVAFPDGTGKLPKKLLTWNSGGIDVYASRHKIDDVGFLKSVVVDIQKRVPVNPDRIYVVGHSNGGMMCHRLAREAADVFDGIAVVAGAMNWTEKDSQSPIATMLIHGTKDKHVLIGGGETEKGRKNRVDASLQDAFAYYLLRNELVGYPITTIRDGATVAAYVRGKNNQKAAPLWVVKLDGGGHAWPGSTRRSPLFGDVPHKWPATRAIVAFFRTLQLAELHKHGSPAVPR